MNRIRRTLFEVSVIFFIGVIIAAIVLMVVPSLRAPSVESFEREYFTASSADRERIAERYLASLPVDRLYESLSRTYGTDSCHVPGHPIGRALYTKIPNFGEAIRQCPTTCAYSCFHGVMMQMFSSESDTLGGVVDEVTPETFIERVKSEARDLCYRPEVTSVTHPQACTHGLGHVFALLSGTNLKEAVDACAILPDARAIDSCASGAFMEYLFSPAAATVALSKGKEPCDDYPGHVRSCYRYKAYGWIKTWGGAQAALAACNSLGDHALDCIESVGRGAATEKTLASGAGISALCMSLSGQAQDRCILGEMMKYIDINIAETDSACTKIDPVYHDACERALADYKDTILYDR
jgi:hypothetical protein